MIGLWFLKSLFTKITVVLAWGFLPVPTASVRWVTVMPKLLTRYIAQNPFGFYRRFVDGVVLPHAHLFATLTAFGEVAAGIGLTFGLLTVLSAALGMLLVLNYGTATQHMGSSQRGFHLLLFVCLLAIMLAGAGRIWGIDGWIHRRRRGG